MLGEAALDQLGLNLAEELPAQCMHWATAQRWSLAARNAGGQMHDSEEASSDRSACLDLDVFSFQHGVRSGLTTQAQRQPPESGGGAHDALPNYPRLANGKRGGCSLQRSG